MMGTMRLALFLLAAAVLAACASPSELKQVKAQVAQLQEDLVSRDAELKARDGELAALAGDLESATEDVTQLKSDLAKARSEVGRLKSRLGEVVCEAGDLRMEYENVLDASTIASAWWDNQEGVGALRGSYRDKLWENGLTAIHGIRYVLPHDRQPYVELFLIYFDELGMKPGVFWVRGQCWLEAP
jgi:hypothetical protein